MYTLINRSRNLTMGIFHTAEDAASFAQKMLPALHLEPVEQLMQPGFECLAQEARLWTWAPELDLELLKRVQVPQQVH